MGEQLVEGKPVEHWMAFGKEHQGISVINPPPAIMIMTKIGHYIIWLAPVVLFECDCLPQYRDACAIAYGWPSKAEQRRKQPIDQELPLSDAIY